MDVERQVYIQAEFAMVKGVFEGHWNALLPTEMYGVDGRFEWNKSQDVAKFRASGPDGSATGTFRFERRGKSTLVTFAADYPDGYDPEAPTGVSSLATSFVPALLELSQQAQAAFDRLNPVQISF